MPSSCYESELSFQDCTALHGKCWVHTMHCVVIFSSLHCTAEHLDAERCILHSKCCILHFTALHSISMQSGVVCCRLLLFAADCSSLHEKCWVHHMHWSYLFKSALHSTEFVCRVMQTAGYVLCIVVIFSSLHCSAHHLYASDAVCCRLLLSAAVCTANADYTLCILIICSGLHSIWLQGDAVCCRLQLSATGCSILNGKLLST